MGAGGDGLRATGEHGAARMTLAEIAIQTMQEERWRGSPDQTVALVRRLCAGRSAGASDVITRLRDAFEALDKDGPGGEVSASDLAELFRMCGLTSPMLEAPLKKFADRLQKQSRGRFSMPELFEHFGPFIQVWAT